MTDLVLADDHVVFVDALSTLLVRNGFTISAVAYTVAQAVTAVRLRRPRMCLLDRHFTDGDCLDAIGRVLAASPNTKVVVLSADRDPDGVLGALRAGASGYLHKSRSIAALTAAMARILHGEVVSDIAAPPAAADPVNGADIRRLAEHLTGREWQCLAMLVEGLNTTAMTARLGVSRTTVRTHVQALLTKLGVHSRLEAASLAVRYRLLDEDSTGGGASVSGVAI